MFFISQRCRKSRLFIAFRGWKIKKIKKYTQLVFRVVYYRKKEQCMQKQHTHSLNINLQVKNRASRDFSLGWSFVNGYGCLIVNKY